MTQETVDKIIFSDINMETTINDLEASPDKDNPGFNDDDADEKSYLTSDNSTVEGNHEVEQYDPIINNDDLQETISTLIMT